MVLAAPTVLAHVPPSRRGLAGGVIFMGVGVGIAASGTLVPLLLQQGLGKPGRAWGACAVVDRRCLARLAEGRTRRRPPRPAASTGARRHPQGAVCGICLNAAGWVPHMIFLVDFVARGMGQGLQTGAQYWVLFGIGATVGPLLAGA